MEGRTIEESKQARRAKSNHNRTTPMPKTNNKIPVKFKDANGRAFTAYLEPSEIPNSTTADTTKPEFAGLASDNTSSIHTTDTIEYEGWLALDVDKLKTSVDWNTKSHIPDTAALSVTSQDSDKPLSLDDHPFYCDTGASVHISPDKNDFVNL